MYHQVFPAKYRKVVFDEEVDAELKAVCLEIVDRHHIKFMKIRADKDHVHMLLQSVPNYSVTQLVTMIKGLTTRGIFRRCPQVKKQLCGGEFWTDRYFANTVGKHGDETMISNYVNNQGN